MKIRSSIIILILCVCRFCIAAETEPAKYAIKAGKILTMAPIEDSTKSNRVINHGIILIGSGKIEALGPASGIMV